MRGVRAIGAVVAVAAALLPAAPLATPVAANGIGDLYVATTRSIIEIRVDQSLLVNAVDVPPVAGALAFSPDGRDLYVSSRQSQVSRIDIGSISLVDPIEVPRSSAGIAFPKGKLLVVAMPDAGALGVVDPSTGAVTTSLSTPGAVDLVAANRRDGRVLAAEAGASWIAVATPSSGTLKTAAVDGSVAAVAVDRAGGVGWVATRSPNALLRVRLSDLKVLSTAELPEAPFAVAAMADAAVAAGKHALWRVTGTSVASYAEPTQAIVSIAASDDGTVLIAAETTMIEAFSADGKPARQIKLDSTQAPLDVAPIPAPSSLAEGGADVGGVEPSSGTGAASAGDGPAPTHMPDSATADETGRSSRSRLPVEGALVVAAVILIAYWLAIRPHVARIEE